MPTKTVGIETAFQTAGKAGKTMQISMRIFVRNNFRFGRM